MLLRLASVLIGCLAAYLLRNAQIHAHLQAKRPLRAFWVWLRTAMIAVPVAVLALAAFLVVRDLY